MDRFWNWKWLLAGVGVLLLLGLVMFVRTKRVSPVAWGWFGEVHAPEGVALGGYDAVSYQSGGPEQGTADHPVDWRGARWLFASAENQERFRAAPEQYAPRFGGFCAFAVSKGFTAAADPKVYHVENKQLYVFDSEGVRSDYLEHLEQSRASSEQNWAKR